jgi:hypothetical protein
MLGVNAFKWNFLRNPNDVNNYMEIYEPKMKLIQFFSGVRPDRVEEVNNEKFKIQKTATPIFVEALPN